MSTLTIQQITAQSLRVLEKELLKAYRPTYKMRCLYGKYHIFKTIGTKTTTLAKGLSKEAAEGMMKLLKEYDDE